MPRQRSADSSPETPGQKAPNQETSSQETEHPETLNQKTPHPRTPNQKASNQGALNSLTVYHDGQFWVGVVERIDGSALTAARVVFGAEPSDEDILRFVTENWNTLAFSPETEAVRQEQPKNPKRRQREASKEASIATPSTKAQQAIAELREKNKTASREKSRTARKDAVAAKYEQRKSKHKQKHRGH